MDLDEEPIDADLATKAEEDDEVMGMGDEFGDELVRWCLFRPLCGGHQRPRVASRVDVCRV